MVGGAEEHPTGVIMRTRRVAEDNLIFQLDKKEKLGVEARNQAESNTDKDANRVRQEHANRLSLDAAGLKGTPAGVDYDKGVVVEGRHIVPYNKRWYVLSKDGLVSQASYESFFDAVHSNRTDGEYATIAEFNKQFPAHKGLADSQKLDMLGAARSKAQMFKDIISGKLKPEAPKVKLEPWAASQEKPRSKFIEEAINKEFPGLRKKSFDEKLTMVSEWADKVMSVPEPPQGFAEPVKATGKKGKVKKTVAAGSPVVESALDAKPADMTNAEYSASLEGRPETLSSADRSRLVKSPPQDRPEELWNTNKPQHSGAGIEKLSPKTLTEHILKFSKWLDRDVRVHFGGSMPRGFVGFLDRMASLGKVGKYEDVKSLAHELAGHVFDSVFVSKYKTGSDYSDIPNKVKAALANHYELDYGREVVNPESQLREGFAMWMEHRLTEQPTRKEVDNWFDGKFRQERPEAWTRLEALHKEMFKYYDQSSSNFRDMQAARKPQSKLSKAAEKANLPWVAERFWQRYQELGRHDKGTQEYIDAAVAYGLLEPKDIPPKLLDQMETNQRWAAFGLNEVTGRPVYADGHYDESLRGMLNLHQVIKSVGKKKETPLIGVLMARRALAGYAAKGLAMRGWNIEDALSIVREGMSDNNIRQAVHNYDTWVAHQNNNIASMSPDSRAAVAHQRAGNLEALENAHKIDPRLSEVIQFSARPEDGMWVPMMGEEYSKIKSYRALQGSSMPAIDPRLTWGPSIIGMYKHAGQRAVLSNTVARMDMAPLAAVGHIVHELTGTRAVEAGKLLQAKIKADLGAEYTEHRGRISEVMVNFLDPWIAAKEGKQGFSYFSVMDKDGKLRFFETSRSFQKAVKDELPAFTYHPLFKIFVKTPAAAVRTFATSLSLPFQMKNLMRDGPTAYRWLDTQGIGAEDLLRLGHHMGASLIDQAQFYAGRTKDDSYFARFVGMGLEHATNLGTQRHLGVEAEGKYTGTVLRTWEHTLNAIEALGSASELSTRTAVARMVMEDMKKGPNDPLSPLEAVEVAAAFQRGTTNFGRQGSWTRVVNMGVPFFTAGIAGLERIPSDIKRNPKKMVALVASGLALGIYHAIVHSEEQWYKETPIDAKVKQAWFAGKFGNTIKPFAIALDEWTGFGWGLGQAIGNGMSKDPNLRPEIKDTAAAYFGQQLSPVRSVLDLAGPVLKETAAQLENWDRTFDRYIVPPNINYRKLEEQATEYTTSFAKKAAHMFGGSPIRWDHVFRAMLPAAQRYWQLGDKLLASENIDQNRSIWGFLLSARTGTKNNVMDNSSRLFFNGLFDARENSAGETAEEAQTRKKLEKINTNLSYLNQMLHFEVDQTTREEMKQEKNGLLTLGLDILRGEPVNVPSSGWKAAAQALRKQQTAKAKSEAQAARELSLRGATE